MDLKAFTPADLAILRRYIDQQRGMIVNPTGAAQHPQQVPSIRQAPDVYIAYIANSRTISARVGLTVGYLDEVPIYRIDPTTRTLEETPATDLQTIYNLGTSSISGEEYIEVKRDKFGQWLVSSTVESPNLIPIEVISKVCENGLVMKRILFLPEEQIGAEYCDSTEVCCVDETTGTGTGTPEDVEVDCACNDEGDEFPPSILYGFFCDPQPWNGEDDNSCMACVSFILVYNPILKQWGSQGIPDNCGNVHSVTLPCHVVASGYRVYDRIFVDADINIEAEGSQYSCTPYLAEFYISSSDVGTTSPLAGMSIFISESQVSPCAIDCEPVGPDTGTGPGGGGQGQLCCPDEIEPTVCLEILSSSCPCIPNGFKIDLVYQPGSENPSLGFYGTWGSEFVDCSGTDLYFLLRCEGPLIPTMRLYIVCASDVYTGTTTSYSCSPFNATISVVLDNQACCPNGTITANITEGSCNPPITTACCPSDPTPLDVFATLTGCSCVGGGPFTLTYNVGGLNAAHGYGGTDAGWVSSELDCGGNPLVFYWYCTGTDFAMEVWCNGTLLVSSSLTPTCNPLDVTYVFFAVGACCDGAFTVEITETSP